MIVKLIKFFKTFEIELSTGRLEVPYNILRIKKEPFLEEIQDFRDKVILPLNAAAHKSNS